MVAIQTENLTKYYGKSKGIENVSLMVEEGEFFGFIGPNGSGKSTTIRTLLGLIYPTAGRASVLGLDILEAKEKILKRVGYLPSEAQYYPGMKVRDVLKLSADLRKKDCKNEAAMLCERLQLDVGKRVDTLSFGNRKKIAIIAALQHNPDLLILDEPTGGLDPLMQKEFFDILREKNAAGATVFLSSHILWEVQKNCTKAAIIRDGGIIAFDTVQALSKTNAKRISFEGEADISTLDFIRDVKHIGNATTFLYGGDTKHLLQTLSAGNIEDLTVSEPNLEEIFLHYYEQGGSEK